MSNTFTTSWLPSLAIVSVLLVLSAVPATAQGPNAELVRAFLWPRDAEEFRSAQERVAGEGLDGLSRLEMLSVEEWMRAGRLALEEPSRDPDGNLPVQQLVVRAPTGVSIPVYVRLPRDYTPDRQWPLMLAMHGGPTGTAEQARRGAERMIGVWAEAADDAGWIVAAPAMESTRSMGQYTPERLPYEVFHVEQAAAVVSAVRERFAVNPDRVVSTGISLGSNFSIAYACARPDWLSAIVPVSTEGDSRERLLRNMLGVPTYLLEGSRDQNIRGIGGPRALAEILVRLRYDIQYREFSDRSHEGFSEHYGDVLRWLDSRPRQRDPHLVLRVPHDAIMPVARRVHWIECDTRSGLLRARVVDSNRIEIEVHRARELRLFLNDHLVDLDRPLEVVINGETAYEGQPDRSMRVALEQASELGDERRFYSAELTLSVPTSDAALAYGQRLAEELAPTREPGTLSFWEMYAARALVERFPDVGFEGTPEDLPADLEPAGERVGLRVSTVDPDGPLASSGLRAGDLLLEFDREPFYRADGGVRGIHAWLVRELRAKPASYELTVWRTDERVVLSAALALGPYREPATSPSDGGRQQVPRITFNGYHGFDEIVAYLQLVAREHPHLTRLVEYGRSRLDRPLLALEINNPDTGSAQDKPGFYSDGNIHGGEVLAGEGMLYLIEHLLTRYGKDAEITELIDGSALYLVPIVNPDGRVISVSTPENHRWNARPLDEDGDGRLDEDPPQDLDGDGRILQMRVPDSDGRFTIDPDEPRRMLRWKSGTAQRYRVLSEGLDDDGDGRFNEDPVGGVDLNRNFPVNWTPAQYASGPYPLSEPESRALVDYITARPNIAAIHTFHTSGGLILRFPTLADQDWNFPQEDLADYREIAREGVAITGYENMAFEKKTIVDLMNPGHGVFNDWASRVFAVLAITTEMWKHPFGGAELFDWDDRVLDGRGFIAWSAFEHPQLGAVELGGWDRWSIASPPPRLIEAELERNARWVVTFARRLPRMALTEVTISATGTAGESFVGVRIENQGWMPTATTWASREWHTAKPVRVTLTLTDAELLEGEADQELGTLPGKRVGGPDAGRVLRWRVRSTALDGSGRLKLTVASEKAGTVRRVLELR